MKDPYKYGITLANGQHISESGNESQGGVRMGKILENYVTKLRSGEKSFLFEKSSGLYSIMVSDTQDSTAKYVYSIKAERDRMSSPKTWMEVDAIIDVNGTIHLVTPYYLSDKKDQVWRVDAEELPEGVVMYSVKGGNKIVSDLLRAKVSAEPIDLDNLSEETMEKVVKKARKIAMGAESADQDILDYRMTDTEYQDALCGYRSFQEYADEYYEKYKDHFLENRIVLAKAVELAKSFEDTEDAKIVKAIEESGAVMVTITFRKNRHEVTAKAEADSLKSYIVRDRDKILAYGGFSTRKERDIVEKALYAGTEVPSWERHISVDDIYEIRYGKKTLFSRTA